MSAAPAFILGTPRSGTTLLGSLLNQHPEVHCPAEPWLLLALDGFGHLHPAASCGPALLRTALADLMPGERRDAVLREWASALYADLARRAGKRLLVDKTPRYLHILDRLDAWFPDAPRIVLLRHPLAVGASMASTWQVDLAGLLERGEDHRLAIDYCVGHARLAELVAAAGPRTAIVRYEELVTDPERALAPVWPALGLAPCPISRNLGAADADPASSGAMGDPAIRHARKVHAASREAWRTALDGGAAETLAAALGRDLFARLGYGDDPPGHWWRRPPAVSHYETLLARRRTLCASDDGEGPTDAIAAIRQRDAELSVLRSALVERDDRIDRMTAELAEARQACFRSARSWRSTLRKLLVGSPAAPASPAPRRTAALVLAEGLDASSDSAHLPPGDDPAAWLAMAQRLRRHPLAWHVIVAAADVVPGPALAWLAQRHEPRGTVLVGQAAWREEPAALGAPGVFARSLDDLGGGVPMRGMAADGWALAAAMEDAVSTAPHGGLGWHLLFHLFRRRLRLVPPMLAILATDRRPDALSDDGFAAAWSAFAGAYTRAGRIRRWPGEQLRRRTPLAPWPSASPTPTAMPTWPAWLGPCRLTAGTPPWLTDLAGGITVRWPAPQATTLPQPPAAIVRWAAAQLAGVPGGRLLLGKDAQDIAQALGAPPTETAPHLTAADAPLRLPAGRMVAACWAGTIDTAGDPAVPLRALATLVEPGGRLLFGIADAGHPPAWARVAATPAWLAGAAASAGCRLEASTSAEGVIACSWRRAP